MFKSRFCNFTLVLLNFPKWLYKCQLKWYFFSSIKCVIASKKGGNVWSIYTWICCLIRCIPDRRELHLASPG